mmetsp:Transcript_16617/g.32420  ORF Transcript_16617/g.32420 Transcript_16617/m.32420 type:complete len:166 (+) Transcript_16617:47-544(+)
MKFNAVLLPLAMLSPSVRAFAAKTFGTAANSVRATFIRPVSSVPTVSHNSSAQPMAVVIPPPDVHRQFISKTTARWMSSPEGEGPSIVDQCRQKISVALETDDVKVIGAYDDPNGSHISIEVVSAMFEGKRPVQRQQLVYKALWEELQGAVHAVDSMICKTPAEK